MSVPTDVSRCCVDACGRSQDQPVRFLAVVSHETMLITASNGASPDWSASGSAKGINDRARDR